MREFVITTESNNDMPKEFLEANGIGVIPHYYTVEEETYGGEYPELSNREFYDAMRAGKKAGTMASNPAVIEEMFTAYAKAGKDILHISFSAALSGGFGNVSVGARNICEEYPGMKAIVIDTKSASVGEGILLMKAVELRSEGKTIEETADVIRDLVEHLFVQFTVEKLDYLYRGGRLSKSSMVLGSLANIKPVLYVDPEGKLVPLTKVRGRKKSLTTIVDNAAKQMGSYQDKQIRVGIMHGDCEEDALYLKTLLQERFGYPDELFLIVPIGPSIGAHSGPGTVGLVLLADSRA